MEFTESNLKFVFDDSHWELITQFDKESDYEKDLDNGNNIR